jgi:hypothetical protein
MSIHYRERQNMHRINSRQSRLLAPLLAAGALAALPAQSHAAEFGPIYQPGNPTCAEMGKLIGQDWQQLEVAIGPGQHETTVGDMTVKVTVDGENNTFSWSSTRGVDAVIAKGGDNANLYQYIPEATGSSGLHAPMNQNLKDWYGLSHIWVCYDPGENPPLDDPKLPPKQDPGLPPEVVCIDYCGPENPYGVLPPASPKPAPAPTPPTGGTLPEQFTSGRSKLTGPTGCIKRKATATVTGREIRKVTFSLDGKRVKTVKAAAGRKRFTLSMNRSQLKAGLHRLTARVSYTKRSATRAKTHKLAFQRCAKAAVAPRFTG